MNFRQRFGFKSGSDKLPSLLPLSCHPHKARVCSRRMDSQHSRWNDHWICCLQSTYENYVLSSKCFAINLFYPWFKIYFTSIRTHLSIPNLKHTKICAITWHPNSKVVHAANVGYDAVNLHIKMNRPKVTLMPMSQMPRLVRWRNLNHAWTLNHNFVIRTVW